MSSVFLRIAMRYVAAALIAKGVLSPGLGELVTYDPEISMLIEAGIGLALGGLVEGWYWLAKRFGWAT